MKTIDLIEPRAEVVARLTEAKGKDDGDAFTAADIELRSLDDKQRPGKACHNAEQVEPSTRLQPMAPRQAPLKQSDLRRYAKAMHEAGYPEWRVEVRRDGTHVIIAGQAAPDDGRNPCDVLLK